MTGYSVSIVSVSKEINAKERLQLKDTTSAVKLDKATQDGDVIIDVDFYAELLIHNEQARTEEKDYTQYIIVDKSGEKYVTGSQSFWDSFNDILTEMADYNEPWAIKAYRMPSKNREGKEFITCSVL